MQTNRLKILFNPRLFMYGERLSIPQDKSVQDKLFDSIYNTINDTLDLQVLFFNSVKMLVILNILNPNKTFLSYK